jgi:hypothetical protein
MTLRHTAIALALAGAAAIGSPARAVVILTLDNPGSAAYQQTLNSPCVIGDPSCKNPAGFDSAALPAGPVASYDATSPTYTVQQIRNVAGDVFLVGIDVNTTTQPLATERLDYFALLVNGEVQFIYDPATSGTQLVTANNGNGYSDALLTGFDLTSFQAGDEVTFRVIINGPTAGREQFFLAGIGVPAPISAVPEPGTLALLGLGLVGITITRRRNRVAASA